MFEIGSSLREARTRRQVGLPQAEAATKIRAKYLRALEDERFDLLPSPTYVKGFLRTYADYLSLDGQLYVDEYNSRFLTGDDRGERRVRDSGRRREGRRSQTGVALIAVAVAVVAVLTVVVISAWKTSGSGTAAPHVAKRPVARHRAAVPPAPPPALQLTAVGGPSKVIVNRSAVGGRVLFEGTLERGETQAFSGKRFWVNVGSPENLVIRVAGKRVRIGGRRPWVLSVTRAGWNGHPA